MIALLNQNNQTLALYTEQGVKVIPFFDISEIEYYMGGQTVLYVTNAIEVDSKEIIDLICNITGTQPSDEISGGKMYLHNNSDKTVFVPDINLKFKGKCDCHLYDEPMQQLVEKSPVIQNLIKKGIISIIGEKARRHLSREEKMQRKEILKKQSKRDKALDTIIIDGSVDDYIESGMKTAHLPIDAEVINMDGEMGGQQTLSDTLD